MIDTTLDAGIIYHSSNQSNQLVKVLTFVTEGTTLHFTVANEKWCSPSLSVVYYFQMLCNSCLKLISF